MNICAECRHRLRGDVHKRGRAGGRIHDRYICGAREVYTTAPDPVTGYEENPTGTPCREVNPDGECMAFMGKPIPLVPVLVGCGAFVVGWACYWLVVGLP